MYKFGTLTCIFLLSTFATPARASNLLSEGFGDITTLAGSGWVMTNNSSPLGVIGWFQGNDAVFASQAGATTAYIGANFNNADFGGNISNWLVTPSFTFDDGFSLTFYTRTETGSTFPDGLEVRLSTSGSSVGATDASVGDFTTLLLAINPTLTVGGYPEDWTLYTINVSGLGNAVTGQLAFRYFVTDTNANADYIGIDTVNVNGNVPEPATGFLLALGLGAWLLPRAFRRGNTD